MSMRYGAQIGYKFNTDGSPRRYPGNTIIADVDSWNPAHGVIDRLRSILCAGDLGGAFIFLPADSYHVTIIRGMNDCVRQPEYWSSVLPLDAPMAAVDAFFAEKAGEVKAPERIHMRFDQITIDDYDVRICLQPWDQTQANELRAYRDQVADQIALRLPGHDSYTYHITLAYMLRIPEGDDRMEMERRVREINAYLGGQDGFWLTSPRICFYNDMLHFYSHRIPRT